MTDAHKTSPAVDSDCLRSFDLLYAYLAGELKDPQALATIQHHLEHCHSCMSRAQIEREIDLRLRASGEAAASDSLHSRLDKLLDSL
ncbi:MAG: zf-HC2 domain-containing protein [Betaproteobacteria bacterium]|nr:zf-HC2 domain-containing protein [Betaproteobacteria bacterium]MDH5221325.1 zf-HC2 domain-containing protein [Betaproteobacteria bacterium]MDH5352129.1 zf-HC2 domain-containing protein [Betaproteobacteria bacterium]